MPFCTSPLSSGLPPGAATVSPVLTRPLEDNVAQTVVEEMNTFLVKARIRYSLEAVKRTDDARCAERMGNDVVMDQFKSDIRQGNLSTFNVLYLPKDGKYGMNGRCYETQPGVHVGFSLNGRDACVVSINTLPDDNGQSPVGNSSGVGNNNGQNIAVQNIPRGKNNNGQKSPFQNIPDGRDNNDNSLGLNRPDSDVGQAIGLRVTTTHEMGHWLNLPHVDGKRRRQVSTDGIFGRFSSIFTRQSDGDVGNVMEKSTVDGKRYKFNDAQIARMRGAALTRLKNQNVPIDGLNFSPVPPQNQGPQRVTKGGKTAGATTPRKEGPRKGADVMGSDSKAPARQGS
ncbi:metalloprotease MEP1 [Metarhizium rileyi]|uniref:Metalloprotease MEP1 n=1 Tax=Metarhizium rileyi (strain RCEF 4871) TaxID=1649241 RepID=A0A167GAU9_METRR|nr:metalloprotease MEP1 [Metarhizium rileyi RCEF 4871]